MDFSMVLQQLNQASSFELYRLKCAIDILIDEPKRIKHIRDQLLIGQPVEYFNPRLNKNVLAKITKLDRVNVVLTHIENNESWVMPYASLNLTGVDVSVHGQTKRGLSRNELAIGDMVCFNDNGRELSGKITKLNPKTAGVLCGKAQWRVSYGLLSRVMDSEAAVYQPDLLEKSI